MPASSGCNREVVNFGRKISLMFFKLFWSVSGWQGVLSIKKMIFRRSELYDQEVSLPLPLFQFSSKPFHLRSNVPYFCP